MFDAHIETAIDATLELHETFDLPTITRQEAWVLFQKSAEIWGKIRAYEASLEYKADLHEYERALEA